MDKSYVFVKTNSNRSWLLDPAFFSFSFLKPSAWWLLVVTKPGLWYKGLIFWIVALYQRNVHWKEHSLILVSRLIAEDLKEQEMTLQIPSCLLLKQNLQSCRWADKWWRGFLWKDDGWLPEGDTVCKRHHSLHQDSTTTHNSWFKWVLASKSNSGIVTKA